MRMSVKTLVASAAILVLPVTIWAQGPTATEPLTPDERAALSPFRRDSR